VSLLTYPTPPRPTSAVRLAGAEHFSSIWSSRPGRSIKSGSRRKGTADKGLSGVSGSSGAGVIHGADALPDKIATILQSRSGAIDVKVSDGFLQLKSSIILDFDFHELLRESPTLSTRMVLFLNPASAPPWKTTQPKHVYAHYSPDQSYEDGYK
jgi:hypothetical protein